MSQPLVPQPLVSQPATFPPVMCPPVTRSLAAIDADLSTCRAIRRAAQDGLAELRRRQEELADREAALLVTIDVRCRLVDRLLDERLRAVVSWGNRRTHRSSGR